MKSDFWNNIKAKSDDTTLQEHTQSVIDMAKELLLSLSITDDEYEKLYPKIIIAAILHDLGKIHPYFQRRLKGYKTIMIRHELVSLWFCVTYLDLDKDILFAIATHHKNVVGDNSYKGLDLSDLQERFVNIYSNSKGFMSQSIIEDWLRIFAVDIQLKKDIVEIPEFNRDIINMLREKKQVMIAYNERQQFSLLHSLLQAADHIASSGVTTLPHYKEIILKDFQPKNKGTGEYYDFRHFQQVMQTCVGNCILFAPTGSGKTEAALNWIVANQHKNTRLVYILPYTASINAMVNRLKKVYDNIVIAQHSKSLSFIYDELSKEESNEQVDYLALEKKARNINSLSRDIYYPVKVATLQQILIRSLRGKGWEFALLDYKNALFIIDEFHVYNALLTGLMLATLKMFSSLLGVRFMFMSATIPAFLVDKIIDNLFDGDKTKYITPDSSYKSDAMILDRKRHHLFCRENRNILTDLALIESLLAEGKSVLVIVNNVRTCQEVFGNKGFSCSKIMLHGGFNQMSRKTIEDIITNEDRSKRSQLLVATQAVEVSLDIDYNVAFIENAPIDALIQRFGRVNRAGNLCDGEGNKLYAPVYLYENIVGRTPFYDDNVLKKTWDELQNLNDKILSEKDLVDVCNEVYKEGYTENQAKDFEQGLNVSLFDKDWIAAKCDENIDEILETNNQKIDVLCYNLKEKYMALTEEKRYIEANQLFVSVYPYVKIKKSKLANGDTIYIAEELFYNPDIGAIEKKPDTYEII